MRFVTGDVTRPDEVRAMFDAARRRAGARPQIVVANAGSAASRPFLKTSAEDFAAMLDVNLRGVFATWQAGARADARRRLGPADRRRLDRRAQGLRLRHRLLRRQARRRRPDPRAGARDGEDRRHRQRRLPRLHPTPMLERSIETIMAKTGRSRAEAEAPLLAANPQGRFIEPEEVAAAVLWLCGAGAASVTGQAISISGGEA